MEITYTRRAAFRNVIDSVSSTSALPQQMFMTAWYEYLFFESSCVFVDSFTDVVSALLRSEESTSCCLLNFGESHSLECELAASIYLEEATTRKEYSALLRRGGLANSWITRMDEYGCSSNKGEWCIYCEKANDIGVIALRYPESSAKFRLALETLRAASLDAIFMRGSATPYAFAQMIPKWRHDLLKNYAHGTPSDR
jgi:hypothetical protein